VARQLALPFAPPQEFHADFLEAPSNAEALAWLDRTAAWPGARLLLWGEAGVGKSHLLSRWAGTVIDGAAVAFPAPPGPLAIDDADAAPEEALLHVLNAAAEAGHPVLLAARSAPSGWSIDLPDLASRLRAVTAVEITPPDDELLAALLARLCAERQLAVAEPIQAFLRARLPRTPAAMREVAARLDRAALSSGRAVTRPLAALVVEAMTDSWQSIE